MMTYCWSGDNCERPDSRRYWIRDSRYCFSHKPACSLPNKRLGNWWSFAEALHRVSYRLLCILQMISVILSTLDGKTMNLLVSFLQLNCAIKQLFPNSLYSSTPRLPQIGSQISGQKPGHWVCWLGVNDTWSQYFLSTMEYSATVVNINILIFRSKFCVLLFECLQLNSFRKQLLPNSLYSSPCLPHTGFQSCGHTSGQFTTGVVASSALWHWAYAPCRRNADDPKMDFNKNDLPIADTLTHRGKRASSAHANLPKTLLQFVRNVIHWTNPSHDRQFHFYRVLRAALSPLSAVTLTPSSTGWLRW